MSLYYFFLSLVFAHFIFYITPPFPVFRANTHRINNKICLENYLLATNGSDDDDRKLCIYGTHGAKLDNDMMIIMKGVVDEGRNEIKLY